MYRTDEQKRVRRRLFKLPAVRQHRKGRQVRKKSTSTSKGTTMRNRIIFLDCDGVLNRAQLTDMRYFVPECFKEFQWIVQATDAQIVISSTWRTYDAWYDMLKDFFGAIDITVVGKTMENADGDKAEEIKNYIREHRSEISNYVVLDDIDFREQFPGHCVCTCAPGRIGLDAEWATEAINILIRKSDEQNT